MTVSQAEKLIADGLRSGNFVKQPQVSILVLQVRGNQASVLGQVNRPGRFPHRGGRHAPDRPAGHGRRHRQQRRRHAEWCGTRDGKPLRKVIDLPGIFRSDSRDKDIVMQNGDVIWVDRAPIVYIYGEVQRPGAMRLERDMTVMQALATGGGLTQRGTEKGMRVHRTGADGKVQVIEPKMDDLLREGDVVYVRESLF